MRLTGPFWWLPSEAERAKTWIFNWFTVMCAVKNENIAIWRWSWRLLNCSFTYAKVNRRALCVCLCVQIHRTTTSFQTHRTSVYTARIIAILGENSHCLINRRLVKRLYLGWWCDDGKKASNTPQIKHLGQPMTMFQCDSMWFNEIQNDLIKCNHFRYQDEKRLRRSRHDCWRLLLLDIYSRV